MLEDNEGELRKLRMRLDDAEATLEAIRTGEVDALFIDGPEGHRVYTLSTVDRPYRLIIERMQEGAVTLSDEATIFYSNRRFAEMVGARLEKLPGAAFENFLVPASVDAFRRFVANRDEGKCEVELRTVVGEELPVRISLVHLEQEGERSHSLVITDLHNEREQERLRLENRRKDEFLAMLAHELRNPLAPISSAISVLEIKGAQATDNERERLLGVMSRQLSHLVRLVDDLLDVARITHGRIRLRNTEVDLCAVAREVIENLRGTIQGRGHDLRSELPSSPVWIHGDPVRLAQVVENILTNAAKYSPDGSVIYLEVAVDQSDAVISVVDNGIGMPAELVAKVFDVFEQGVQGIDRSRGGLGIGLALVKRLVELHGGTVAAFSEGAGKGSTFTVRLPLRAA